MRLGSTAAAIAVTTFSLMTFAGCHCGLKCQKAVPLPTVDAPRELTKVTLPEYVIEPPDVLSIDAVSLVPLDPQQIGPLDVLSIDVTPSFPGRPIEGTYQVNNNGTVNLGAPYGSVAVTGLSVERATSVIEQHLRQMLDKPSVSVSVAQSAIGQQIAGDHLVGPDGTVSLGAYGRVHVTGLTVNQAQARIELYLKTYFSQAKLAIDIAGYNSKVYYVITEGAGFGDGVARFPVTGSETVLDAVSQINGMSQVSSKHVWIARPAPDHIGCDQILPVDWVAITKGGATRTNYQIMPGDRVFIAEDRLVSTDTALAKVLAPIERVLGITLLGGQAVNTVAGRPNAGL